MYGKKLSWGLQTSLLPYDTINNINDKNDLLKIRDNEDESESEEMKTL